MPTNKRVNLESLITKEELEQFNDIRVKEIPDKIEELGEGKHGYVSLFKFKDGNLYAGKRSKINLLNRSPEDEKQIKMHLISALGEIRILHQLSHERIIETFGFYLDQDQIIIFMEQMRGSVKNEVNDNGYLTETAAMHYFTQAAEGLVYLHGQKPKAIIHRDIKCENLLLTAGNNVKLADFGLAVDLAISSESGTMSSSAPTSFTGTCFFIAPEIIGKMHQPEAYGRKSDIWSLACTLVQMINGEPPYKALNFVEFVRRSSSDSQNPLLYSGDLLPTASIAIKKLLNSMFTVNCKLRPNAEAVLALAHDVTSTISNGGELGNKSQDENQRESVSERSEEYSPKLPATEAKNSATSEEHSSDIKQTEDLSSQAEANEENATEITEDVPNTYYRTMLTRKNATTAGIVVAAGVATALAAPVVAGAAVGALGFGATGVAAGSWAATMMAWGGGTVPAAVAVLQSVGAAGIAGGTQVYAGLAASGVAARLLR